MRDHDEVYRRVIAEIERYEQRRQSRRMMVRTRVLPVVLALTVLTFVGLYMMWKGRSGNGTGIVPGKQPGVTNIAENPSEPPKGPEPAYAREDSEPTYSGELNGYDYCADSQIRNDGKEAYAYTRLNSTEEGSSVSVTAEFHGIDRKTQLPVVISVSENGTENEEGQYYGVVRYQVPADSDVVIVKVISSHIVSEGGVGWSMVLSEEKSQEGFNQRLPFPWDSEDREVDNRSSLYGIRTVLRNGMGRKAS